MSEKYLIPSRDEVTAARVRLAEGSYRSPHKIPACTRPSDAKNYPLSHKDPSHTPRLYGPECPLHSTGAGYGAWQYWYAAREKYATAATDAARERAMRELLSWVTESNPPVDPEPVRRPPQPRSAPRSGSFWDFWDSRSAAWRRTYVLGWGFLFAGICLDIARVAEVGIVYTSIAFLCFFACLTILRNGSAAKGKRN